MVKKMLDKEIVNFTRNGIVKTNLTTGKSELVVKSDYAKEMKYRPQSEGIYHSNLHSHAENNSSEEKIQPNKKQPHANPKNGYVPESDDDSPALTYFKPNASGQAIHKRYQEYINSGTQKSIKQIPAKAESAAKVTSSQTDLLKKPKSKRFKELIFYYAQDIILQDKDRDDDNPATQAVKTNIRAALRFHHVGIRKGIFNYADDKALQGSDDDDPATQAVKTNVRTAKRLRNVNRKIKHGTTKKLSILKHPALIKMILMVLGIFMVMVILCAIIGEVVESIFGGAQKENNPELTSYVEQLDKDFTDKIISLENNYEKDGNTDVTVVGNVVVNTDPCALAILATGSWTSIDMTEANKALLKHYYNILNTYTVTKSDSNEQDSSGTSQASSHTEYHVTITVHTYTAKEKIDDCNFKAEQKENILDSLNILEQIEEVNGDSCSLKQSVIAYREEVTLCCKKYGISGYEQLVLAVMQQESGGSGGDPMQCSECSYNTKYQHTPNSITDPDYSIEIGVKYLSNCLKAAKCKSPNDMQGISLALQGYNFGNGYIEWALKKGGYSQSNAVEFSQTEAKKLGVSSYGDPEYVNHVLRYYSSSSSSSSGTFIVPLKSYKISRGYGYDNGKLHKGIDFAAAAGTDIYASADGTVVFAGFGKTGSGYGGYGNVVLIKHNSTYSTLYGHCSKLIVKTGETVRQGEVIALVGSTGDSTGNHCHFEIRVNNVQVDPASYLNIG